MDSRKIKINRSRVIVYVIMIVIIIASLQINKAYASTTRNILSNFGAPATLLFFGLSWNDLSRMSRVFFLVIGSFWFLYISLHFLVGFHNPYWGN